MYQARVRNQSFPFQSLNEVLGKANEYRSGDQSVGLSAADEKERVAAQYVLAELPLKTFYENPSIPYEKCEVTRTIIEGIDSATYVSGFIGPEILYDGKQMIRANLEDLCMAKLLGLPMGMAPCYTTHAEIDQNDHEIATMLLSLGGAQYFMAIGQNDDVMLSYQDTSFHDNVALRQINHLKTTPEFEGWMEKMGLLSDGIPTDKFGDPNVFQ